MNLALRFAARGPSSCHSVETLLKLFGLEMAKQNSQLQMKKLQTFASIRTLHHGHPDLRPSCRTSSKKLWMPSAPLHWRRTRTKSPAVSAKPGNRDGYTNVNIFQPLGVHSLHTVARFFFGISVCIFTLWDANRCGSLGEPCH